MAEQAHNRTRQHTPAYYFTVTLVAAALLTALGVIQEAVLPPPPGNQVQLSVVCVSGFSWDRVIPLHQSGKLPLLSQLFRGKGSYGDIVSSNAATDAAIIASLFTGSFPEKHKIYREDGFRQFLVHNTYQTPIWQELINRGQECVVVGLPFPRIRNAPILVLLTAATCQTAGHSGLENTVNVLLPG